MMGLVVSVLSSLCPQQKAHTERVREGSEVLEICPLHPPPGKLRGAVNIPGKTLVELYDDLFSDSKCACSDFLLENIVWVLV